MRLFVLGLVFVLQFANYNLYAREKEEQQISLTEKMQPITEENIFWDPDYYHWCNSIIKGKDGKYHLFYSRWEKEKTFMAWLTHSTVAHAVADNPAGPYKYVNTVIKFDGDHQPGEKITAHNPKIKYFDGKYYLYFISTKLDFPITDTQLRAVAKKPTKEYWKPLRENQRTYVATSESLDGEWKISDEPLLEPEGPIATLVVNPAITQGEDGRYYLIVKGDEPGAKTFKRNQAIAVSNYPDRGFKLQDKPVIKDWDTEDVSMWYDKKQKRQYAVFHAHSYIGMMTSKNGIDWEKAKNFKITKKEIKRAYGQATLRPKSLERPFVYVEKNVPRVLSAAVATNGYGGETYIVFIPLKK